MNHEHVELWPQGAPLARGTDSEDRPHLDLYLLPEGEKPHATIIVCPGGGYGNRAGHEGEPIALWLNKIGISALVLHYRVAPYRHPAPLLDAQRAIRIVRSRAAEWHLDPERIGILGFSAGGHLAATAGTHFNGGDATAEDEYDRVSCRPDLMILCYPVISFGKHRHQGSMINLLGEESDDDLRQHLSNELQVTSQTPPAFLWHTANDASVPVENSLMFAASLSKHHIPFDLHVYENGVHGLGLASDHPEAQTWTQACERWLRHRGF